MHVHACRSAPVAINRLVRLDHDADQLGDLAVGPVSICPRGRTFTVRTASATSRVSATCRNSWICGSFRILSCVAKLVGCTIALVSAALSRKTVPSPCPCGLHPRDRIVVRPFRKRRAAACADRRRPAATSSMPAGSGVATIVRNSVGAGRRFLQVRHCGRIDAIPFQRAPGVVFTKRKSRVLRRRRSNRHSAASVR